MKIQKQDIKDFLVVFSVANLFFIRVWYPLVIPSALFYQGRVPAFFDYFSVLFALLLFSSIFYVIFKKLQKCSYKVQWLSYLIITSFFLYRFDQVLISLVHDHFKTLFIVNIFLFLLLFKFETFYKKLSHYCFNFFLILSLPWIYFIFLSPFHIYSYSNQNLKTSFKNTFSQIQSSQRKNNFKVVWIIFDELDQKFVFEKNDYHVSLKALKELYNTSFHATKVYGPTDFTVKSILSYLFGDQVVDFEPTGPVNGKIQFKDRKIALDPENTIFNSLSKEGYKIGVAGWHLPYCGIFKDSLEECYQFGSSKFNYFSSSDFLSTVKIFMRRFFPDWMSYQHLNIYDHFMEATTKLLENDNLDLVYLHFPIPHFPQIYNRHLMKKTSLLSDKDGYPANLILVDESFKKIKNILDQKNSWDNTVIIVSSDHWLRLPNEFTQITDYRVPFIVKLQNDNQKPADFNQPFSSIMIHDLIPAILKNEIKTSGELESFILKNSSKYSLNPIFSQH